MAFNNILSLLVVCAVVSVTLGRVTDQHNHHSHHEHDHEEQIESNQSLGRFRRQAIEDDTDLVDQDTEEADNNETNDGDVESSSVDEAPEVQEEDQEDVPEQENVDENEEGEQVEEEVEGDVTGEEAVEQEEQNVEEEQNTEEAQTEEPEDEDLVEDDDDDEDEDAIVSGKPTWTTCDWFATPKKSCGDCNTRLICKPIGGLLKPCLNPTRPYCNHGICSAVPNAECT